jgi:hypothetical protein
MMHSGLQEVICYSQLLCNVVANRLFCVAHFEHAESESDIPCCEAAKARVRKPQLVSENQFQARAHAPARRKAACSKKRADVG